MWGGLHAAYAVTVPYFTLIPAIPVCFPSEAKTVKFSTGVFSLSSGVVLVSISPVFLPIVKYRKPVWSKEYTISSFVVSMSVADTVSTSCRAGLPSRTVVW